MTTQDQVSDMIVIPPGTEVSVFRVDDVKRQWTRHVTRKPLSFLRPLHRKRLWISSKRCTIGVTVEDDVIQDAAPIARKFIGQKLANLLQWLGECQVEALDEVRGSSGAVVFREGEWLILTRMDKISRAKSSPTTTPQT